MCVLIPDRKYEGLWHRILHDRTADALARDISTLPHVSVTTVPFHLDEPARAQQNGVPAERVSTNGGSATLRNAPLVDDGRRAASIDGEVRSTGIGDVRRRERVRVTGRVESLRVQPLAGSPVLECTLVDDTGGISIVFLGRRSLAGLDVGSTLTVEGMVIEHRGRLAIINPLYRLH